MNTFLEKLYPYPFERLNLLLADLSTPASLSNIPLSLGEPQHPAPQFIIDQFSDQAMLKQALGTYPTTSGLLELKKTIADWLTNRFDLEKESIDAETQVLPVNGTREALFAFAQAVIERNDDPAVLLPNPFYQIYEGAAILAGAQPIYLNCTDDHGFLPDFSNVGEETWLKCQLLYLCTPANPSGAVMDLESLQSLIALADSYDFVIASDECYSEIYMDEAHPPVGLLQACSSIGRHSYSRCLVFNSLSKRSNLPGLRSGFVAGDRQLIAQFLLYRTYHGSAMSIQNQTASMLAWRDEEHVIKNRANYLAKFDAVLDIIGDHLEVQRPSAGFYLWPRTSIPDEEFTRQFFQQQNVTVLPGSYLSRQVEGINPGSHRVRMALVAPLDRCTEAALRMVDFLDNKFTRSLER